MLNRMQQAADSVRALLFYHFPSSEQYLCMCDCGSLELYWSLQLIHVLYKTYKCFGSRLLAQVKESDLSP